MRSAPLIAVFCLLTLLPASAAVAPKSQERLKEESTHVIKGMVIEVTSEVKKSEIERGPISHTDRIYSIKVRVAALTKGEGIKEGDVVVLTAWRPETRIPPLPGSQGNEGIPEVGDSITAYVIKRGELLKPIVPNGIQTHE